MIIIITFLADTSGAEVQVCNASSTSILGLSKSGTVARKCDSSSSSVGKWRVCVSCVLMCVVEMG